MFLVVLEEEAVDRIGGGLMAMKPYQICLDRWLLLVRG